MTSLNFKISSTYIPGELMYRSIARHVGMLVWSMLEKQIHASNLSLSS